MTPSIARIVMSTISAAGMVPKTSVSMTSICVDIDAGSFLVLARLDGPVHGRPDAPDHRALGTLIPADDGPVMRGSNGRTDPRQMTMAWSVEKARSPRVVTVDIDKVMEELDKEKVQLLYMTCTQRRTRGSPRCSNSQQVTSIRKSGSGSSPRVFAGASSSPRRHRAGTR